MAAPKKSPIPENQKKTSYAFCFEKNLLFKSIPITNDLADGIGYLKAGDLITTNGAIYIIKGVEVLTTSIKEYKYLVFLHLDIYEELSIKLIL